MKRLLALAVALTAVTMLAESNANAQNYNLGYQFGTGVRASQHRNFDRLGFRGDNFRGDFLRRAINVRGEQLPYFAQFPPVYYSNIVKRPYGISPYAAPSGIVPVEMTYAPATVTIKNPFFNPEAAPAKAPAKPKSKTGNKMTVITNPYMSSMASQ